MKPYPFEILLVLSDLFLPTCSEGFITKQFQNTIWVPEMAHPTENALGSSTSQSKTDIPAKSPEE